MLVCINVKMNACTLKCEINDAYCMHSPFHMNLPIAAKEKDKSDVPCEESPSEKEKKDSIAVHVCVCMCWGCSLSLNLKKYIAIDLFSLLFYLSLIFSEVPMI